MREQTMEYLKRKYMIRTIGVHSVKYKGKIYHAHQEMKEAKKKSTWYLVPYLVVATIANSFLLVLPFFSDSILFSIILMLVVYSAFIYLWLSTSAKKCPNFIITE